MKNRKPIPKFRELIIPCLMLLTMLIVMLFLASYTTDTKKGKSQNDPAGYNSGRYIYPHKYPADTQPDPGADFSLTAADTEARWERYEEDILTIPAPTDDIPTDDIVAASTQERRSTVRRVSAGDIELVARVIYAEARNQPYEGMLLVGQCVLDRSEHWGKSISDIANQPFQFGVASIADCAKDPQAYNKCLRAARAVAYGSRVLDDYYVLYFRRTQYLGDWHAPYITKVAAHTFYGYAR